jgi:hypothetical protein
MPAKLWKPRSQVPIPGHYRFGSQASWQQWRGTVAAEMSEAAIVTPFLNICSFNFYIYFDYLFY